MASDDFRALVAWAGGWEGFEIAHWATEEELEPDAFGLPAKRLIIELRPHPEAVRRCSRCGNAVTVVHDVTPRRVRDLPLMGRDVWLVVPQARVECPRCGRMPEQIAWLDRYQRVTQRLAEALARLAQEFSVQAVARLFHVDWTTVKVAHQRALHAWLGPLETSDLAGVRQIAIDEFALHKGQTYATLVVDVATRRVLWVARGRHAEALDGFFAALGRRGCAQLEAVVIDLARPFVKAVRTHCPNAAIVYDLFHALQRYTAQVLDRVRFDEANKIARPERHRARAAIEQRRRHLTGKGVRWLLLRARSNLRTPADRVRLDELLAANHALFVVYVLKEDLRALWKYRRPAAAARAWRDWYQRACESGIAALVRFAHRLAREADYIINHAQFPLHTSLLEGINNKIKVMKRMAYGYRDDEYFFLRIRAAFPGNS
ncbi:MAG TPA: ISL3 family transposase [Gemmatimonadales bacterium]|nr:ISL3 family transposase [Gemmatimonadales bacterium]